MKYQQHHQEFKMSVAVMLNTDPRLAELCVEIKKVISSMLEKVDVDSKAGQFTLRRIRAETSIFAGQKFDSIEEEIAALKTALEGLTMWNDAMRPVVAVVIH